jgi:hypothetical protein
MNQFSGSVTDPDSWIRNPGLRIRIREANYPKYGYPSESGFYLHILWPVDNKVGIRIHDSEL